MSSSMETLEPEIKPTIQAQSSNPNNQSQSQEDWVKMSKSWLATFPEGKTPSISEFETWLESNQESVPQDVKSMDRSEIYKILMSIQTSLVPAIQEKEASEPNYAYRFQRTDLWRPVYTWLESLDTDELVKANEIANWLTENPTFRDQLSSKHSRYHLKHYIKKCHMKILKRRERKKNLLNPNRETPVKVQKPVVAKQPVPSSSPYDSVKNLPKDSALYIAKHNEALQKFEILVALENELSTLFPKYRNANI